MKDWNDDDDDDDEYGVHQVRVVVNWKDDDKFRTNSAPHSSLAHPRASLRYEEKANKKTQLLTVNDEGRSGL